MALRIVLDTNVFVSALLGPRGASRVSLRACLSGRYQPLMGTTLFLEYKVVMDRETLFTTCHLTKEERETLLDAFLSVCHWQKVYLPGGRISQTKPTTIWWSWPSLGAPLPL
jgi:predicted nucleic acid-binding protein